MAYVVYGRYTRAGVVSTTARFIYEELPHTYHAIRARYVAFKSLYVCLICRCRRQRRPPRAYHATPAVHASEITVLLQEIRNKPSSRGEPPYRCRRAAAPPSRSSVHNIVVRRMEGFGFEDSIRRSFSFFRRCTLRCVRRAKFAVSFYQPA